MAQTAAALRPRLSAGSGLARRLLSARNLVVLVVLAIVAYLGAVPLGFLLWQTFVRGGHLTVANFRGAYTSVGIGTMVGNSLAFAFGSTAVAIAIGSVLAYLIVRTDVPGKPLMFAASLVPLIIPGILHTIAWIFVLDPNIGVANRWVIEPLDGHRPFNVYSIPGMIVIEGLHLAPLVFLLMVAAFRSMDPALEESAIMSGASLPTVFRRVTLPLVRPALYAAVLIMVVRGLESFEVPSVVGLRYHIWVFTSRIWQALNDAVPNYGQAGAYAMSLLVLTTIGVLFQSQLAKRARAFQTITGKGFRPHAVRLGAWRWPATALIGLYFLISVVLPLLILLYASTQRFYAPPSRATLSHMSLANYPFEWRDPVIRHAVLNSLYVGVGAATGVMVLAAVASWVVVRTRLPGRYLVDNLAFMPLAIPGLVLGVALLTIYLRVPIGIYGTLWILFMAYLTRYMPYGMRYASTSMFQIGRELEESAQMSGAGWWHTFRRIVLPLLAPGLVAGWIYIVIVSFRELGSSVLLYSPGKEVLSIVIWEQWRDGLLTELSALGVMLIGALVVLVAVAYRLGARIGVREA
ncbi:MAG TPA: iron ABC transporter permease [Gaiellaceae bacterium]|nr:iron ABC transporter permease [Gaiellaceae bacterium]